MTEENAANTREQTLEGEAAKTTPEGDQTPEEKKPDTGGEPESTPADPDVTLTKKEHEALLKAREVGETYKKENEGYRKKERESRLGNLNLKPKESETPASPEPPVPSNETQNLIWNDYQSKLANVNARIEEKALELTDEQFNKVELKIKGAWDAAFAAATKGNRYVAEATLEQEANELIDWAKGGKTPAQDAAAIEVEKAKTAIEIQKQDAAEIGGVKPSKDKGSTIRVTNADKRDSEETMEHIPALQVTPEQRAETIKMREQRLVKFKAEHKKDDGVGIG